MEIVGIGNPQLLDSGLTMKHHGRRHVSTGVKGHWSTPVIICVEIDLGVLAKWLLHRDASNWIAGIPHRDGEMLRLECYATLIATWDWNGSPFFA